MTILARLFVGLIVVPTTIWIALAVYYHLRRLWLRWVVSLVPVVVVGVSLRVLSFVPWALAVWLGLLVISIAWWFSLRPRSDRDWALGMEVLPRTEIVGDTLRVRHFRNFNYMAAGEPIPRYEERTYDLAKLSSLDYFLSHWSGPVMAHTLVTFGFDDGQFLCVSVEARRQHWQRYSPLWGLFRSYELIFVLGDERDFVRVRTNIRRERVYMYRLRLPPQHLRRLILDYVRRVEMLATQPGWYNSVTSNCTTNLFYQGHARVPWWMKPGIFLNGFSARTMYRLGFLSDSLPFKELQARCAIRELALAAGDAADFSRQIRSHIIMPPPDPHTEQSK
ncbi:MAG TPA: DUF4105 domain-containing protein [Pirellulales bacterium]|nr:DUF4105 domain-containing protein [Pirellulales bacterium]